jgi:hypothetical protein
VRGVFFPARENLFAERKHNGAYGLFYEFCEQNIHKEHAIMLNKFSKVDVRPLFKYLATMFADMGMCMTIFEKNLKGLGCAFFSKIVASLTLRELQFFINV